MHISWYFQNKNIEGCPCIRRSPVLSLFFLESKYYYKLLKKYYSKHAFMKISSWAHLILNYMLFFWWKAFRKKNISLLLESPIYISISSMHKTTNYCLPSWFHCLLCTTFRALRAILRTYKRLMPIQLHILASAILHQGKPSWSHIFSSVVLLQPECVHYHVG